MTTTPNIWVEDKPAIQGADKLIGLSDGRIVSLSFKAFGVEGHYYDADGSALGSFTDIDNIHDAVATDDGGFALVYMQTNEAGTQSQIKFLRFDDQGQATDDRLVATGSVTAENGSVLRAPSIAMFGNGDFAVMFARDADLRGVVLESDGAIKNAEFQAGRVGVHYGGEPTATDILSNGDIVVAQTRDPLYTFGEVEFTILDPSGNIVTGPRNVEADGDRLMEDMVALEGGGFVVVYSDRDGDNPKFSIFDNSGDPIVEKVDLPQGGPLRLVALQDGGFALLDGGEETGNDFVRRYDAQGQQIGSAIDGSWAPVIGLTTDGRIVTQEDGGTLTILDPRDAGETVLGTSADEGLTAPVGGGTVNGRGGVDRVYGHNGDDTFIDNDGLNGEHYDGGDGIDTIDYSGSTLNGVNGAAFNFIDLSAGETVHILPGATGTLANIENVEGSQGGETITDDFGTSIINANGGNDRVRLAESFDNGDVYDGGAGTDTLDLTRFDWHPNFDPIIDLAAETLTVNGGAEAIRNFENIDGGEGSNGGVENLLGTNGVNVIDGNGGDDLINGRGMADHLSGGEGDDVFVFGGIDVATGETIDGGSGSDTLRMLGGQSFHFNAAALTSIEAITFDAFAGERIAEFNAAQFGGAGIAANALITGNAGTHESLDIQMGAAMTLDLSALRFGSWTSGDDRVVITGSASGETIIGTHTDDVINAGGGHDTVHGGGGSDILDGGSRIDTLSYEDTKRSGVTVSLAITTQQATGGAGDDTISNFENLIGSAFDDSLTGSGGDNMLAGGGGDDLLNGGAGNDMLDGGAGADELIGGLGADSVSFSTSEDAVIVNLDSGRGYGGDAARDTYNGIEDATGSAYNDQLYGNKVGNILNGGDGADSLIGGLGADTLMGGTGSDLTNYAASNSAVIVNLASGFGYGGHAAGDTYDSIENATGSIHSDQLYGDSGANILNGYDGNDSLLGGLGADRLIGGNGLDVANYAASNAAVIVNLASGFGYGGHAAGDVYSGVENATGSIYNDQLYGDAGANIFNGYDGNDSLMGGLGADMLIGGGGLDVANYSGSNAAVIVNLASGFGYGGHAAGDSYSGVENATGSTFNDQLYGDTGSNILNGFDGNDTLIGGLGSDTLIGGSGSDLINYSASDAGVVVNLSSGTGSFGHAAGDSFSGIENVTGSNFRDVLIGSSANNILRGGGGDDTFQFGPTGGSDTIMDFSNDIDTLDLSAFNFASVSEALGFASDTGPNVLFDFNSGTSLLLVGLANVSDLGNDVLV